MPCNDATHQPPDSRTSDGRPLRLVAGLLTREPAPGDYGFFGDVFGHLPHELPRRGRVGRYLGWKTQARGEHAITLLGLEVDSLGAIPDGRVGLEFGREWLRVHQAGTAPFETPLSWHVPPDENFGPRACVTGGFRCSLPKRWRGGELPAECDFGLLTHLYADFDAGPSDEELFLVEPRAEWNGYFAQMASWIDRQLGSDLAYTIDHVGSTAVPGLVAKPVVDIVVRTPEPQRALARLLAATDSPEWECWYERHKHTFIKRERPGGRRTHHLHLLGALRDGERDERVLFRDYLRTHPEAARRYARIKRELIDAHVVQKAGTPTDPVDRAVYTEGKGAFVHEILRRARGAR
ncbi:MAG: GrpB family protein [Myxococcales bacterium]|nr:GrpB family protein [Myxococcales bacterium]